MHWFYLLLSFGALLLAITTVHGWLLLLSLLAALGFFLAWIRGWYLDRIGGLLAGIVAQVGTEFSFYLHKVSKAVDVSLPPIAGTGFAAASVGVSGTWPPNTAPPWPVGPPVAPGV